MRLRKIVIGVLRICICIGVPLLVLWLIVWAWVLLIRGLTQ